MRKSLFIKITISVLIMLPLIAFGHYLVFPQETNCILINFTGFKRENNIYFKKEIPFTTIRQLNAVIRSAEARNVSFWGTITCRPHYIFCPGPAEFKKYGSAYLSPAATHTKMGAYIVISSDGLDTDIIAHELCHAELYSRLGFINYHFKIPAWFDEGLAMQLDNRKDFSEDSLKKYLTIFKKMPTHDELNTSAGFAGNNEDENIFHYAAAKYELKQWHSKEKLDAFTRSMNNGEKFHIAFGRTGKQ